MLFFTLLLIHGVSPTLEFFAAPNETTKFLCKNCSEMGHAASEIANLQLFTEASRAERRRLPVDQACEQLCNLGAGSAVSEHILIVPRFFSTPAPIEQKNEHNNGNKSLRVFQH